MITGLTWLLACQLLGEVLVRVTGLPVPGPVLGMVVLFAALQVRRAGDEATPVRAADALLRHLQLFFVPAGVGVVAYLATIRDAALPILLGVTLSWLLGLVAVGWTAQLLTRGGPSGSPERSAR